MKHVISALLVLAAFSFGATAFAQDGWTQSEPRSSMYYPDKDSGQWKSLSECGGRLKGCDVTAETLCREIWYVREVKIVPRPGAGAERIISCSNKDKSAPSAASTPEAVSFIENCPYNGMAKLVSDCTCIARTLQTLPSVPPDSPPKDKPTKRAAEACTLGRDALARNMTASIRASRVGGGMAEQAECIGQRFAIAYRADPGFNMSYIERLRKEAYRACASKAGATVADGSAVAKQAPALPSTVPGQGGCKLIGERLVAARQKGGGLSPQMLQAAARRAGCGGD